MVVSSAYIQIPITLIESFILLFFASLTYLLERTMDSQVVGKQFRYPHYAIEEHILFFSPSLSLLRDMLSPLDNLLSSLASSDPD